MVSARFFEPMPQYFLIKIGKVKQAERKEKEGSLYFPQDYAYLKRGLQFGEIVAIGSGVAKYMPYAEIGDLLLHHHFIEAKKSDNGSLFYLVDEDADFNYYLVNGYATPGEKSMCYGIVKGREIIPSPDYIFLEVETDDSPVLQMTVTAGGILMPKEKKKTREEWTAIMKDNVARIQQLARNIPQTVHEEMMAMKNPEQRDRMDYAIAEIKKLESQNYRISKDINKKRYELFKVAAVNPEWSKKVESEPILPGDMIYLLNMAGNTKVEYFKKEYIVAEVKYVCCSYNWLKSSLNNATSCNYAASKEAASRG